MAEDFYTRLIRVLDSEEDQCRRELASHRQAGQHEDLLSFSRGTLWGIDLLRGCSYPDDVVDVMANQAAVVSEYGEAYAEGTCDLRTRLTYLWHAGAFVQMDMVAQRLRIYARQ